MKSSSRQLASTRLRYVPWFALVLLGVGTAMLRFQVLESPAVTQLCDADPAPYWCGGIRLLIAGFLGGGFGYAALAGTALALLWKHPFAAWLAAALGLLALNLYCYEAGALALLVGCLCLLRPQAAKLEPAQPNRQPHRQIQAKP